MFVSNRKKSYQAGFRKGVWTALFIASPFIIAGAKRVLEKPLKQGMERLQTTAIYTGLFDKEVYEQKKANERLDYFRIAEGLFDNNDTPSSRKTGNQLIDFFQQRMKKRT